MDKSNNGNLMKKVLFTILLAASAVFISVLLHSCSNNAESAMQVPNFEEICVIKDNDKVISDVQSIDIIDENRFVISDMQSVYLYDIQAARIKKISHSGRAQGEYILPMTVRYNNGHIYVWSAGSLSFLVYDLDGNYINGYPYNSAISDFLVDNRNIYVYTAGKADDYIIDVIELPGNKTVERLINANDEHVFMNKFYSVAPMASENGKFYFSPKDKLKIYGYNSENGSCDELLSFESKTFIVEKGINEVQYNDANGRRQVLGDNSLTLGLLLKKNNFYLMTLEGKLGENIKYADSGKYFAIYDCSKPKEPVSKYPYSTIGKARLIDTFNGSFYILSYSTNNEDDFVLNRIIL